MKTRNVLQSISDVPLLRNVFYWNILRSDNTVAGKIICAIDGGKAKCSVILYGDEALKATNLAVLSANGIGFLTASQKAILLCLQQAGKITEDEYYRSIPDNDYDKWFRQNHYVLSQEI